uniref:C2H2-type domain-containing protein n=1 Tax=Xiphophorus couchianus TaxID=32473 RepID=A0A3B5M6N2_9TELE
MLMLHDPKPQQIKEEEKEVCISLGAEQLNGKEEIDVTPVKSEDEIQSILLSQNLYEDKIKDRDLPEENDEGEFIKIENHEDGSIFSKIEVIVKDEEDDDVQFPVSEPNHLPDSGLKTKDEDNDWTESRATESDGNIFSEFAEQFLHHHSIQKDMTHSEIRSTFSCEDCGKTFIRKYNFNRHKRIHTEQKSFCCELCEERFNRKSNLSTHVRSHTRQPFCCDLCGQRFVNTSHLNSHKRIHTGLKPFCCDICGKGFAHKPHLSAHTRIHTGQKPFCLRGDIKLW